MRYRNVYPCKWLGQPSQRAVSGRRPQTVLNANAKKFSPEKQPGIEVEKIFPLKSLVDSQDPKAWDSFKKTSGELKFAITDTDLKINDLTTGSESLIIKTISISIPAVVGPYQTFNAILEQTENKSKIGQTANYGRINQKIVISRGIDDSGLFVLDFSDERYLPFEGTGAISKWTFTLKNDDIRKNISDIIFTIKYVIR